MTAWEKDGKDPGAHWSRKVGRVHLDVCHIGSLGWRWSATMFETDWASGYEMNLGLAREAAEAAARRMATAVLADLAQETP